VPRSWVPFSVLLQLSACLPEDLPPRVHFFFLTRQNELRPNHPKVRVNNTASATRPDVVCPAWYFEYSRTKAPPPMMARHRKTKPVTSSQSCPRTRPN